MEQGVTFDLGMDTTQWVSNIYDLRTFQKQKVLDDQPQPHNETSRTRVIATKNLLDVRMLTTQNVLETQTPVSIETRTQRLRLFWTIQQKVSTK